MLEQRCSEIRDALTNELPARDWLVFKKEEGGVRKEWAWLIEATTSRRRILS